jgi:hypothetical protein
MIAKTVNGVLEFLEVLLKLIFLAIVVVAFVLVLAAWCVMVIDLIKFFHDGITHERSEIKVFVETVFVALGIWLGFKVITLEDKS